MKVVIGKLFVRTIVFNMNRLESALAVSKISFLRNIYIYYLLYIYDVIKV